jgi:AraC family transcriptional regulator
MSLNKPATGTVEQRWSVPPRWYLWDGGFLLFGQSVGLVPPHAHHAIQIVITVEGDVSIRGKRGDWQSARAVIVRPDVEHSFDGGGALGAMLFVDPESLEGAWLQMSLRRDITVVPPTRVASCVAELKRFLDDPFASMEVGALVKYCVHSLCTGVAPGRRLDARITRVLEAIRRSDEVRMSVDDAAALAFLSPSRFAHLFKQQMGLPFRRYLLWRKLARAMLVIGRQETISTAAHEADFADAAHLTRTFYQMFGIPPSLLMRGEFIEIASPFAAPDSAAMSRQ